MDTNIKKIKEEKNIFGDFSQALKSAAVLARIFVIETFDVLIPAGVRSGF